jgi:hypothetical protein
LFYFYLAKAFLSIASKIKKTAEAIIAAAVCVPAVD